MQWIKRLFSFLILICLVSCGSNAVIVHGLTERDANEILTYLHSHSIPASKKEAETKGGGGGGGKAALWDIEVTEERSHEAMALLNAVGLPRRREESLLDIFANTGLVPSDLQDQIRYQSGLAEQLSSIIRKFDGVLEASVQLSFPKDDPLNPRAVKVPATAAVYLKHNGVLDDPNSHLESKIRRLVSNSVPNLNYDNVTVVGERTRYGVVGSEGVEMAVGSSHEEPLVSVWEIVLAKRSLSRFRAIFFAFFVALLLLLVTVLWMFWKLLPVLKNAGGLSKLFSLHPLAEVEIKKKTKEEEEAEAEDKENAADQDSDLTPKS